MTDCGITITFGDRIENHVGMEILGTRRRPYTFAELKSLYEHLKKSGFNIEFIDLTSHLTSTLDSNPVN